MSSEEKYSECDWCRQVSSFDDAGYECFACDLGTFLEIDPAECMTKEEWAEMIREAQEAKRKLKEELAKKEKIAYFKWKEGCYRVLHLITDIKDETKIEIKKWSEGTIEENSEGLFEVWGFSLTPNHQKTKRVVKGITTMFFEGVEC